MNYIQTIKDDIYETVKDSIPKENIIVENPKDRKMADYAVPCFAFSKIMRKSPIEIANYIKENINKDHYEKIEVVNGYLNIFLKKKETTKMVLETIRTEQSEYGSNKQGLGKTIVIDYSAPNIAKPFGVGHLRSTVIGASLKKICEKNGYKVIGINHLGDWGTQFGKLIYAYKTWGEEEQVKQNPIDELKRLYVKFHEEAEKNPELDNEGRKWFKKLEDQDEEALTLWKWFREESLKEFEETYQLLGIEKFDSYNGESFYNDKMQSVIDELEEKNLLSISEGASIVDLGETMPPALVKRSDGATLYITRDLSAIFYRKKEYQFDEILYVVGNEQTLHFNQLKAVITKMGYDWADNIHHINFGMILQDGKKMSTRKGKSVKLHDVLVEAVTLAQSYMEQRNNTLENKEEISKQIGVGAVIFNDLKNDRTNDIEFNLEETIRFEGETGPYLQYTYARINSLLSKKQNITINYDNINIDEYKWNIIFRLYNFNDVIIKSKENYDPSLIAKYLLALSGDFNRLYANEKIIDDNQELTEFRLQLSEAVAIVLKEGMRLLNMDAPNRM